MVRFACMSTKYNERMDKNFTATNNFLGLNFFPGLLPLLSFLLFWLVVFLFFREIHRRHSVKQ